MRFRFAGLLLFAAACAWPADAGAELRFCNKTAANATVSIAYVEKDAQGTTTNGHRGVTTEGWWVFTPGECAQVSEIHVGSYWVYYHAHSPNGVWEGPPRLCVPSRAFRTGDHFRSAGEGCPAGYQLKGFRRIDTDAKTYTLTLR